jgi:hypothetical protein
MRNSFTARGGVEIDTQGDAFFFAFARARDAVEAAVDAQRQHASNDWPDERPVRVRMGLHTGEPAVGNEGYLGIDVVRAARLCTVGRGGQVILSETTKALIGSSLPDGVTVHTLGERHLKDIDEPERVFELDIEGAPTPAAPADGAVPSEPSWAAKPAAPPEPPEPPEPPAPRSAGRTVEVDPGDRKSEKPPSDDGPLGADFGERLSQRIQAQVRRKIEDKLERKLSEVDRLIERAAENPEAITRKLDRDEAG